MITWSSSNQILLASDNGSTVIDSIYLSGTSHWTYTSAERQHITVESTDDVVTVSALIM